MFDSSRSGSRSPTRRKYRRRNYSRSRSPPRKNRRYSYSRSPSGRRDRNRRSLSRSRSIRRERYRRDSRSPSFRGGPRRVRRQSRPEPRRRSSRGGREDDAYSGPLEENKLYVANLNFRTRAEDVKDEFSRFGQVQDVFIPPDRETGGSRGFAFVTFTDHRDADDAVDTMDGKEFDGRVITVQKARARRAAPGYLSQGVKEPCRDFQRGLCQRGTACRYRHNSRSRSRSISKKYPRSRSRSRSYSQRKRRSISVSRSRSR